MKKIRKILALALAIFMLAGLMPTNVFADDTREKINKIVATSDTDSIPTYGGTYKRPTFKVTEGKPAYFAEGVAGYWLKKEGEEWNPYGGTTFTEGTYKYKVQIRIDGWTGTTYVLDENGVTATVDGNKWADNRIPAVGNSSSYVWTESKEYAITAPVGAPLGFVKDSIWNIPLNYEGKAIETFSVAKGATGGKKPYTFSKVSGPDWINVANDGTVSGTPTGVGTNENLVICVTDNKSATAEITLTVAKTVQDPSKRTKINEIVATSNTDSILKYGEKVKNPTFNMTKGEPAYFNVEGFGSWYKKEGEEWKQYWSKTFTEGTYKYLVQIRIDGEAGRTHALDKNGVTVTVDEKKWADNETPSVDDESSIVNIESGEYVISKTAQEKLIDIPKANTNLVYNGNPQTGVNEGTGYTLTGNTATNAGTYTAKATLEAGYKWKDGTKEVKNIPFEIEKADPTYTVPTGLKGKKDKKLSTVTLPSGFTWVDGETVLNTVGENTFKAKFTPTDINNYKVVELDVNVMVEDNIAPSTPIDVPVANTNLIYNTTEQTGVNEGTGYTITGNTATNAGTYTAKATLKAGYKWSDESTEDKEISFEIKKADPTYTVPTGLKGKKDKKLSTVTLPSGFTWVDGEIVLDTVGEKTFKAKFTPTDINNYKVVELDVKVMVKDNTTPPPTPTPTPDPYYPGYEPYRPHRPHKPAEDKKAEEKPDEKPAEKAIDKPAKKVETEVSLVIGSNNLDTKINGTDSFKGMDVAPYIKNARTMLPIRHVAEALGMSVSWDAKTRTVIIQDMFYTVEIPVDTNKIIVNGVEHISDVKPEIVHGRTMLPIANIARALGLKDGKDILWDAAKKQVTIIRTISR